MCSRSHSSCCDCVLSRPQTLPSTSRERRSHRYSRRTRQYARTCGLPEHNRQICTECMRWQIECRRQKCLHNPSLRPCRSRALSLRLRENIFGARRQPNATAADWRLRSRSLALSYRLCRHGQAPIAHHLMVRTQPLLDQAKSHRLLPPGRATMLQCSEPRRERPRTT